MLKETGRVSHQSQADQGAAESSPRAKNSQVAFVPQAEAVQVLRRNTTQFSEVSAAYHGQSPRQPGRQSRWPVSSCNQTSPVRSTPLHRRQWFDPRTQSCSVKETPSLSRRTFNPVDYKRQSFCSLNSSPKWLLAPALQSPSNHCVFGQPSMRLLQPFPPSMYGHQFSFFCSEYIAFSAVRAPSMKRTTG